MINIAIQGGPGSFNEQALIENKVSIVGSDSDFEIVYSYSTERVLYDLRLNNAQIGQFAISNSIGGVVKETEQAFGSMPYNGDEFEVISEYKLQIAHCLMCKPDIEFSQIEKIITHPQVIAQCRLNLKSRYSNLELEEGEGEFADPARIGMALMSGELPSTVATLSSRIIASKAGLKIIDSDLQDRDDNYTTFLAVRLKSLN